MAASTPGAVQTDREDLRRQLEACDEALTHAPDDGKLHRLKGKLLKRLGHGAAADASLAEGRRLRLQARTTSIPECAVEDFARALKCMRTERAVEAEILLDRLVKQHPRAVDAWLALRGVRWTQKSSAEANAVGDEWRLAVPEDAAFVDVAMARSVSRRGLIVDAREPLCLAGKDEILQPLAGVGELSTTPADAYFSFAPGHVPVHHEPIISVADDSSDRFVVRTESVESFVAVLQNAALVGRGLVVTQRNQVVRESLFAMALSEKYEVDIEGGQLWLRRGRRSKDVWSAIRIFDRPAFLMAGPTDTTFGDWIWKFPPRLTLAQQAGLDVPLVVNAHLPSRHLELLELLGYDRSHLLFHDPDTVSLFPKLFVPSWPTRDRLGPMKDWMAAYEPLSRRGFDLWCEGHDTAAPRPRIYISRTGIRHRSLVNEGEVIELFKSRGFQVVQPEALSWQDVLRTFACPSIVAGAYGSGLRNLVMCHRKPLALVMMPPWFNTPGSSSLLETKDDTFMQGAALWLAEAGIRFAYVRGEPVSRSTETWITPWTVDVHQLERALDRVLEL